MNTESLIKEVHWKTPFVSVLGMIGYLEQKENPSIHADSRNSKNIQGFVNTLDILGNS